ncbi:ABC-F family ATP-binding cassette domain-containing protein [Ilumatobacter sp.]|uniref:ABC-F family ATP-binding cassette domain-containing protein n=1 Tax=Ilumatobacter sp. TaxID=1967498 RepID=UPI003C63FAB5
MSVRITDLSFHWPSGRVIFDHVDAVFSDGVTGLVGDNGIGKTTLLRLIVGDLQPTAGHVTVTGRVGYLPQDLVFEPSATVADAIGIRHLVDQIRAVEAGDPDADVASIADDDWLVENRAVSMLDRLDLPGVDVDRPLGTLSGGEVMLVGLAGLLFESPDVLILDEPTNNLDTRHRTTVLDLLRTFSGPTIVVSHDRGLLEHVDHVTEIDRHQIRVLAGNLEQYEAVREHERDIADQRVKDAERDVRRQQREFQEALIKVDRRERFGKKMTEQKRRPKVIMNELKRRSQVTSARLRYRHQDDLDYARQRRDTAADLASTVDRIQIELPDTTVATNKVVLVLDDLTLANGTPITASIHGPERIALTGANGAGKTTLLRTIAGDIEPVAGTCTVRVPIGYLTQRHEHLDEQLSVLDNVQRRAPTTNPQHIRSALAHLSFTGELPHQSVRTLSGGERFRAALSAILLTEPSPQLLLLDEPTNNLDFASVDTLVEALNAYRGALIVATHDQPLIERVGINRTITLDDLPCSPFG